MGCAYSAHLTKLPEAQQDETNEAAREGTCAAWVVETIINGDATCADDMVGKTHKNGWLVDADMARHVQPFIDLLNTRTKPEAEVYREWIDPTGAVKLAGTLDAESWSFDGGVRTYHVDDLKYGYGIIEPDDNWQLLCYLALRASATGTEFKADDRIQLGIYQPRAQHPDGVYRTWTIRPDQAHRYFDQIRDRIQVILGQVNALATPGDHCAHCEAGAICQALTASVYDAWEVVQSRAYSVPTAQQLADEMEMLIAMQKLVKARLEAVTTEAENRPYVPGWAKQPVIGQRAWKIADAVTIKMFTGIDPVRGDLVTPAELERRGAKKETVNALTRRPTVGMKFQRVDEKSITKLIGGPRT